jgi:hypothetical protein
VNVHRVSFTPLAYDQLMLTSSQAVRDASLARVRRGGFKVSAAFDHVRGRQLAGLRPPNEIAARLMALDLVFSWVSFAEKDVATARLEGYRERNQLAAWLSEDEAEIAKLSRAEARAAHLDTIGWKLESMLALAWALGFEASLELDGAAVDEPQFRRIVFDFLPGLDSSIETLLAKTKARAEQEIAVAEDLFYCAHNAVVSAQLGGRTTPRSFDPLSKGGVIVERRQALTWCLSRGVSWDDTDLNT